MALPPEGHPPVSAGSDRPVSACERSMDDAERHRLRSVGIGEFKAKPVTADTGAQDHANGFICKGGRIGHKW